MSTTYLSPLVSMVLTFITLRWMLMVDAGKLAMDHPNERSLHSTPVPRTGGLALVTGVLLGWGVLWHPLMLPLAGCVLFLMMVSFADDMGGLSVRWRFLAHFAAAVAFVTFCFSMSLSWMWLIPMLIAIVWMTNLYNFMDGSDGLAGGMALFGFGSYGLAAWMGGDLDLAVASLVISTSALAFLRFNFHPARIFMGDAGSIPLGFLSATLGLIGWQRGDWPLWFPVLVFSPFIVDATVTLTRRLLRGEKVWQAHREHYYQRLVQMGWGHRGTALAEYVVMVFVGALALLFRNEPAGDQHLMLALVVVGYAGLMRWMDRVRLV